MADPFARRALRIGPVHAEGRLSMQETAETVDRRRSTLRRNLVLVASYLAVMGLIALGYQ
jgi:predicted transcriptional regulator